MSPVETAGRRGGVADDFRVAILKGMNSFEFGGCLLCLDWPVDGRCEAVDVLCDRNCLRDAGQERSEAIGVYKTSHTYKTLGVPTCLGLRGRVRARSSGKSI